MSAPSATELEHVHQAAQGRAHAASGDYVVHWRSSYGVILIEVRAGRVYVNGEPVQPPEGARGSNRTQHP